MDFTIITDPLKSALGDTLPNVLGALLILVIGWFAAILVRAAIRKALNFFRVNERLATSTGNDVDLAGGVASVAYYVLLLLVLVAFFGALHLEEVSGSLQGLLDEVFAFAPRVAGAAVLLLVAWLVATVVRGLATRGLAATNLDERLSSEAGMRPISESLGNVLFWLILLLFLPAILGTLEMTGLLDPVERMVDQVLGMLPNILAAAAIGIVGWFVARILRDLVANLLAAAGVDRAGARAGLSGDTKLSGLLGLIVYIFVFVPTLIAALNALQIRAISEPATEMLATFMAALPNIFGAAVILAVAYFVSTFIASLVATLLNGLGFDRLPERMGLSDVFRGVARPSDLVAKTVVFFVMLFATVEAASRLGFTQVSGLVAMLIEFGGQVVLGIVIIAVGFWISNLAADATGRLSGPGAARVARFAILGIVVAMGLRAMGLADDIVNLAFGLTLGSVAVAVALSFGLGGREAAGRQMEYWLSQLRKD
ncbi:MAG: mechanosensitive ion channel [Myxococcales bacterium]|nr:mechanosensitive ion channel [Myxococcales bacterium]